MPDVWACFSYNDWCLFGIVGSEAQLPTSGFILDTHELANESPFLLSSHASACGVAMIPRDVGA